MRMHGMDDNGWNRNKSCNILIHLFPFSRGHISLVLGEKSFFSTFREIFDRGIILFSWIEFFSRFHFDFVISRKKISLEIGPEIDYFIKIEWNQFGKEFVRRGVNISTDFRLIITWERNFFYPAIINNSWAGSPRRKEQHPDDHWERKIASRGADSCWN